MVNDIINVDSFYNKNYDECLGKDGVEQTDFDYFIESSTEARSMLYFDTVDRIIELFLGSKDNKSGASLSINEITEPEDTETRTIKTELVYSTPTGRERTNFHRNGELSEKKTKEINESNERAGREAENIAYIELKKSYPNLIWNSKYSTMPADKNNQPPNNIVCDMWNHSKDGNTYFEIKSSITEFEMSINEYESMKNNKNNYYVILVNRETKEISKHLFNELDAFKEPSKYRFVFKQKQSNLC